MIENYLAGATMPNVGGAITQALQDAGALRLQQLQQQQGVQQMQQAQQNMAINAYKLQQAQSADQAAKRQLLAYQQAVADFSANPTAQGAADLQLRFPDQAKAIQESWKTRDEAVQTADRRDLATVYSALNAGRTDLAQKLLEERQAAEEKAGKPEPMVGMLLDAIKSDPAKAKGIAAYVLSSIPGGEDFARTLSAIDKGQGQNHVINEGGALVDNAGNVLYQAGKSAKYEKIRNADGTESIVEIPQSGPSGVSAGGQTHTGGWTPRARHGGDNSDAAVNNKIAGASKFLGVSASDDISGLSPMKIAQAMTLSEGGKGTLADRNNNPANIRNSDGSYKTFPTKEAGLKAAAALVARKLKNGQTTVQSMIEGLPIRGAQGPSVAGGARVVATSQGDQSADGPEVTGDAYLQTLPFQRQQTVKAIAEGRATPPKPGTKFGQAILEQVAQYDPTFDAANAQSRQKTRVDFTSGKAATAVNALNTAMGHLIHLDDQARDLGNSSFAPGIVNPIWNWSREKVGNNTALPAFNQTKQAAASEMRKVFAGSQGGNLAELEAWEKTLSDSQSYEQLHTAIKNGVQLMSSRLEALQEQYTNGMGRSDQPLQFLKPSLAAKANRQFGINLDAGQTKQPQPAATAKNPPAGATRAARNPKTGQMLYLVNGKWVGA